MNYLLNVVFYITGPQTPIPINEQLISHLSPLGWEHINLSGDYVWRTNLKLGQGKYRSLRSVDSGLYKKQS